MHIGLEPGQKLDPDELCTLLNVSKNPLREAELATLACDILSFRCSESNRILKDHEELVTAIEQHDKETAFAISKRHPTRYTENIAFIKSSYPQYFK